MSNIEWTEKTWNPVVGCTAISPGCKHCYAETMAKRLKAMALADIASGKDPGRKKHYIGAINDRGKWSGMMIEVPEALTDPLRTKKPTRWFVNSMSDLFHEGVSDEYIDRVFAVMALTPQHTYQILTKRPERMWGYVAHAKWERLRNWMNRGPSGEAVDFGNLTTMAHRVTKGTKYEFFNIKNWPLPNVWLGVSVENQKEADRRIPILLKTFAAVRWISAEPLLGEIDLTKLYGSINIKQSYNVVVNALTGMYGAAWTGRETKLTDSGRKTDRLDWVVVGGESGPGARPFDIQWARDVIAQCKTAGVPCFVKQLGAAPYSPGHYPLLQRAHTYAVDEDKTYLHLNNKKGGDMSEWPEDLRVREMPEVSR